MAYKQEKYEAATDNYKAVIYLFTSHNKGVPDISVVERISKICQRTVEMEVKRNKEEDCLNILEIRYILWREYAKQNPTPEAAFEYAGSCKDMGDWCFAFDRKKAKDFYEEQLSAEIKVYESYPQPIYYANVANVHVDIGRCADGIERDQHYAIACDMMNQLIQKYPEDIRFVEGLKNILNCIRETE